MRPMCLPAQVVLVRGVFGLAAALVLWTWRGFGLEISFSGLNGSSSSPSGVFALAVPGLFFELKVTSKLACASVILSLQQLL